MKNTSCSWMKLKLNYKFNEIPIKILIGYFMELGKLIPKFTWQRKCTKAVQKNYEKEKQCDKEKET